MPILHEELDSLAGTLDEAKQIKAARVWSKIRQKLSKHASFSSPPDAHEDTRNFSGTVVGDKARTSLTRAVDAIAAEYGATARQLRDKWVEGRQFTKVYTLDGRWVIMLQFLERKGGIHNEEKGVWSVTVSAPKR